MTAHHIVIKKGALKYVRSTIHLQELCIIKNKFILNLNKAELIMSISS